MELVYTLPAVIGLGVLHSLEPGHGKGIITAYLISSGAKIKDAITIGWIAAMAHTLSITLIAVFASSAVMVIVPENLIHWFQLISGIVVIYIGLNIITQKLFDYQNARQNREHERNGCSSHCSHHHYEPHAVPSSRSNLFLTGFFTGIIPCPSAIAILLAAVSADKIPLGLGLVGAFSIGGAITMVVIAVFVVRASNTMKKLERWQVGNRLAIVSSVFIIFLGGTVIFQSLELIGISSGFK